MSDYIHRSGRTGRIGANGECLVSTLVSFKPDVLMLQQLELALRRNQAIHSVNANIKQQLDHSNHRRTERTQRTQRTQRNKN